MRNLPPLDPHHERNAPWNQDHPEPTEFCQHCDEPVAFDGGVGPYLEKRAVYLDDLRIRVVEHTICKHCSNVIEAQLFDNTEGFLKGVRECPEEVLWNVDQYTDLKEIER